MRIGIFAILLILFTYTRDCMSSPSITSVNFSSRSFSISGSSFGSSANVPLYYSNFEGDTVGEIPIGQTTNIAKYGITTSSGRSSSHGLGFHFSTSTNEWKRNAIDLGEAGANKIYVSYWALVSKSGSPDTIGFQIKTTYFTSCSNLYSCSDSYGATVMWNNWWFDDEPADRWGNVGSPSVYTDGVSTLQYNGSSTTDQWLFDEWQRVEFYVKASSTANATDGHVYHTRIGRSTPFLNVSNVITHSENSTPWRYVDLWNAAETVTGGTLTLNVDMDDVYVDTTPARVEICDAATFAERAHCEVQPRTAWADGTISATLNRGTFSPGDIAYVFVVDADNVPSAGYQITIPATRQRHRYGSSLVHHEEE